MSVLPEGSSRGPYVEILVGGQVVVAMHPRLKAAPMDGPYYVKAEEVFQAMRAERAVEAKVLGLAWWIRTCPVEEEREVAKKVIETFVRRTGWPGR